MKRLSAMLMSFLVVLLTVAFACNTSTTGTLEPDDRVSLALNQSGRVSTGIEVKVDSLYDSRCPVNVNCIWQGNVILRAVLTKGTEAKSVRLILGPDPANRDNKRPDSTGVVLGGTTYNVVLRDVVPYPGSAQAQPTQAIIQVKPS